MLSNTKWLKHQSKGNALILVLQSGWEDIEGWHNVGIGVCDGFALNLLGDELFGYH